MWLARNSKNEKKVENFEKGGFIFAKTPKGKMRQPGWELVSVNPRKTDYAPPRPMMAKAQAPQPEKKEEKKKPAPQPQKLPDPVVKGRADTKSFDAMVSDTKRPEGYSSNAPMDAVKMAENAWTSRDDSDKKYKQAKEKAQSFRHLSLGDHNNITGQDSTNRVMRQNQQMTARFQSNWQDYLNPSLPKRPPLQSY